MRTSIILILAMLGSLSGVNAMPNIELDPIIESFVPENRIMMKADISSDAGLKLARTYFKASDAKDYVFTAMRCDESFACDAILPAPSKGTASIDYLILVLDADKKVYKSQTFTAVASDDDTLPAYQTTAKEGTLEIKTGLSEAPKSVQGFTDSLTVDTIESTARFGVVVGIYRRSEADKAALLTDSSTGTGAAAGTTAGAVAEQEGSLKGGGLLLPSSGGTVVATSAGTGISTSALILGGAVAVGAGGVAVAAGGGGGDDDGGTVQADAPDAIAGTWYLDMRCVDDTQNIFDAIALSIADNTGHYTGSGSGSDETGTFSITVEGDYNNQTATTDYTVDSSSENGYLGRDTVSNASIGTINGKYDTGFIQTSTTREGCDAVARFYQK